MPSNAFEYSVGFGAGFRAPGSSLVRSVHEKLEECCVSADDYDTLQEAADENAGKMLYFTPGTTYTLTSTLALTSSHNGIRFYGPGATIQKGFNGSLITLSGTQDFSAQGLTFNGQHGTFTGKGLVFSGTSHYPKILLCDFEAFTDSHIEFGADAGYSASVIGCDFHLAGAQTDPRCIHGNGPDTGAAHRQIMSCGFDGNIDLDGTLNTQVIACRFTDVLMDSASFGTKIAECTWASSGAASATIDGSSTTVVGNRIAKSVVINSTAVNYVLVGNHQTDGTFTDNVSGGNLGLVLHRAPGSFYKIAHHWLQSSDGTAHLIQTARSASIGDASVTYNPGSVCTLLYQNAITADRTVTLSTTDAITGQRLRVVRQAGATGAFNVIVGSFNLTAEKQWIELEYDGSAYQIIAYGTLP